MEFSTLEQDVLNRANALLEDIKTGSVNNALRMLEDFTEMSFTDSPEYVIKEQTYFGNSGDFTLDSAVKSIVNLKDNIDGIPDDKLEKLTALLTAVCHAYLFNSVNKVLFRGCALPGGVFRKYMTFSLNKLIWYFIDSTREDDIKYIKDPDFLNKIFDVLDILKKYADNHIEAWVNEDIEPSWYFNVTLVPQKGFTIHYVINVSGLVK